MYQFVREGKKMGDILYGFCLSVFIVYLIFGDIIFEKYQVITNAVAHIFSIVSMTMGIVINDWVWIITAICYEVIDLIFLYFNKEKDKELRHFAIIVCTIIIEAFILGYLLN